MPMRWAAIAVTLVDTQMLRGISRITPPTGVYRNIGRN